MDENGVTHYSDQPVPGATKIEVRAGNVSAVEPASAASSAALATSDRPNAGALRYRRLRDLSSRKVDESIINTGGQVNVEIRVNPASAAAHTLSLYLDGKLVTGSPPNSLSYVLTEVPRGVHSVTRRDHGSNRQDDSGNSAGRLQRAAGIDREPAGRTDAAAAAAQAATARRREQGSHASSRATAR